jgi:glycosyltransferase involved in cell wall biosynthesis
MKIVHMVYSYTPGSFTGGVAKVVHEISKAQVLLGHQVEVWPAQFGETITTPDGVVVRPLGRKVFLGNIRAADLSAVVGHPGAPDVIHAHNTFHFLNLQAGKLAREIQRPVFYHPHGALDPSLMEGFGVKELKKRLYIQLMEVPNLNRADGVFALSDFELSQLREIGVKSPIHVLPNGIESNQVVLDERARNYRPNNNDVVNLLFIGRINPKKQLELIIQSLHLCPRNVRLLIAGDTASFPSYYAKLQKLIVNLGLNKRVIWLGFLDEREKVSVLSAADIFIHASKSEGMAMAILEAMSCGLPVVCTPGCYMSSASTAGALREVPATPSEISGVIRQLLDNSVEMKILSTNALQYISNNHNWPKIARQAIDIYQAALQ